MKWFLLAAILLAGCYKNSQPEVNEVESVFSVYLETSDDPLAKARRDGSFDLLSVPSSKSDLYIYQVNFLKTRTGKSKHSKRCTYDDLIAESTCTLPDDPSGAAVVITLRFNKPVTVEAIHGLAFGCTDWDFVSNSGGWQVCEMFAESLESGKPITRTIDAKVFDVSASETEATMTIRLAAANR